MLNLGLMSRRDLLHGAFFKTEHHKSASASQVTPCEMPKQPSFGGLPLEAIQSDFTPDMLRAEAERLGLDADNMEQEALLAAICLCMQEQRGE
ncbi:MAG: hypothetical protein HWE30_06560 [Methylocystaceae bacterium]|nr:hypothetical protein [Methylocystaceae bacterium]